MAAAKIAAAAAQASTITNQPTNQSTNQQQAVKQALQFFKIHPGVFFLNKNMAVATFLGCFFQIFFWTW